MCMTQCFTKYPGAYPASSTYDSTARRAIALAPAIKAAGLQRIFDNFTRRMELYDQNKKLQESMSSVAAKRDAASGEQRSLADEASMGRARQRMRRTCGLIMAIGIPGALYCVVFRWNDSNDFFWYLVLMGCTISAIIAGVRMRNNTQRGEGRRAAEKERAADEAKARFSELSAEYSALEARSTALIETAVKLGGMLI